MSAVTVHTCNEGAGPFFGRKTAGCPRCEELLSGAVPRGAAWRTRPGSWVDGDAGRVAAIRALSRPVVCTLPGCAGWCARSATGDCPLTGRFVWWPRCRRCGAVTVSGASHERFVSGIRVRAMSVFDGFTAGEILDVIAKLAFVQTGSVTIEGAEYAALVICSYGDYHGSDLDGANYRELIARYGQIFYTRDGYHGERSLLLVNDRGVPPFETVDGGAYVGDVVDTLKALAADLAGLEDYPLLSEEMHSAYIGELAQDAWNQYMRADMASELDAYAPGGDASAAVAACEGDTLFEAYFGYDGNEWTAETATSVVNGRHADAVRHVAVTVFGWDVEANAAANRARQEREDTAADEFVQAWSDYRDRFPLPYFVQHNTVCGGVVFRALFAAGAPMTVEAIRVFVAAQAEQAAYLSAGR
jgi:hypothetical protein